MNQSSQTIRDELIVLQQQNMVLNAQLQQAQALLKEKTVKRAVNLQPLRKRDITWHGAQLGLLCGGCYFVGAYALILEFVPSFAGASIVGVGLSSVSVAYYSHMYNMRLMPPPAEPVAVQTVEYQRTQPAAIPTQPDAINDKERVTFCGVLVERGQLERLYRHILYKEDLTVGQEHFKRVMKVGSNKANMLNRAVRERDGFIDGHGATIAMVDDIATVLGHPLPTSPTDDNPASTSGGGQDRTG